jgi:predicted DNA-binding protein
MGILVNFISADEDDLEAIGESLRPVDEWSGVEARDIDIAKLITLHTLLTGEGVEDVMYAYEPVYGDVTGAPPLILRLPDEVKQRLAALQEESVEAVAEELAATEVFEYSQISFEEVEALIADLAELGRIAESQEQTLFVWMHPLLT